MIMEIKMNNSLTFDEVADKLGCSVEDLQKIALENGLIDENGNPTEMAIREGLFSQYATMEDLTRWADYLHPLTLRFAT